MNMLQGIDQVADNSAILQEINVYPIKFYIEQVPIKGEAGAFREVHRVELAKKGTTSITPWTIKSLKQESLIWPHVEPFYEKWVQGQEEPTEGTPLSVCAFLVPLQIDALKVLHIRSVEDLAKTTDADGERIGIGWRVMREKAVAYVKSKEGHAAVAELMAERDAAFEAQGHKLQEMMDVNENLVARLEVLEAKTAPPPKAKRAKKNA